MKKNLFLSGMTLFLCLFLAAGAVSAQTEQTASKEFTTTGTSPWSLPTDVFVTGVSFEAIGGGGAGGYVQRTNLRFRASGGGSGAAYAKTTLGNFTQGQTFSITVGEGGTNPNGTSTNGGNSIVNSNGTDLLIAAGGVSVNGTNNTTGASARAASESKGDLIHVGGKGSNSYGSNSVVGTATGAGGGAGGPDSDGGNATNAGSYDGGKGGTGGGGDAGNGRNGTNVGPSWPGDAQPGYKYGGGGPGAWCTGSLVGVIPNKGLGGPGGQGFVRVTYTYVTEYIGVENMEKNICSGTNFDEALDITVFGYDLADAVLTATTTTADGISISNFSVAYNTVDNKWHVTGTFINNTSITKTAVFNFTAKSANEVGTDDFTVTVNVYGKIDGGVIAADQFVCHGKNIKTLKGNGEMVDGVTTAKGSGGSGNFKYQWYAYDLYNGSDYELIQNADGDSYTPTGTGVFRFMRAYTDNVCGVTKYATNGSTQNYLVVTTVDPFVFDGAFSDEDTICSNASFSKNLFWSATTPASGFDYGQYWQVSTDKGSTWTNLDPGFVSGYSPYALTLTPSDFSDGDDLWYRAAVKIGECDSIPSNEIYKIHVKEVPDYTTQFADLTITLWYGACDTSIAALTPELTPVPASVTRTDDLDRVAPGEYTITWRVINDDCNIAVNYSQKVIVEYPECGTLANPLTMVDNDGKEYQTIRIGCECWMAENLRTNASEAVYYEENDANEQFGKLYTWADAVGCNETLKETKAGATYVQGVLPNGWSIPTMAQYNKLLEFFSTEQLKSNAAGTWLPDHLGTNESGFNMKAGGYYDVEFQRLLGYADFWVVGASSSEPDKAPVAEVRYDCDGTINCVFKQKTAKMSVRGVRVSPK